MYKNSVLSYLTSIIFIFLFLSLSIKTFAQNSAYPVYGRVLDKETKQPLPYANIRKLESSKGTMTNTLGYYNFLLEPGISKIVFSYLGYRSDTISVDVINKEIRIDVNLSVTSLVFPEVTSSIYRYNPAERIILSAIANKKKFLSNLHNYKFEAYTKTAFRVEKKIKQKDTINSTISNERNREANDKKMNIKPADTIMAGILESQIRGYWEEPDNYKEEIIARKQTANFQPTNNILTVGKLLNFNDDEIIIENNRVIGPTAPNAMDYYSYEMIDTTAINDIMVFRIRLTPKKQNIPLFDGIICIADSTFSIMEVNVTGNESFNLPMISSIRYRQQYSLYDNIFWLPVDVRVSFQIKLFSLLPIFIEQVSALHDYIINSSSLKDIFDEYQIKVLPTADKVDSAAWSLNQMLPLTDEELKCYHTWDSLVSNAGFFQKTIISLTRFITEPNDLPFTSFSDFFRFNRVEGTFLGLGLTSGKFLQNTNFKLSGGYAISSKDWKYSFGIEQVISENNKTLLGLELYKQINSREDFSVYDLGLNSFLCITDNFDYYDYYLSQGWKLSGKTKLSNEIKLDVEYRDEDQKSLQRIIDYGPLKKSSEFRVNPPIDEGKIRATRLKLDYDNRKLISYGPLDMPVMSENTWTINTSLEYTDNNTFKSDFKFLRGYFTLHGHLLTYASGSLDIYCQLGLSSGVLPVQEVFDLQTSASGISSLGVFKTLKIKEFQGDNLAAVFIEHNFGSYFFRSSGIPLIKDLGIDFIITASAGLTDFLNKSPETEKLDLKATKSVFYEAGFSLSPGNLFPFFRIDFSWRLTHRTDKNFAITFSSYFF